MHIFYFIFVQFMQFPVLHFGLAHSGSQPFNWLLAIPQSGLSDAGKVTLKFVSQSSSRIQDSQVSTPLAQFEDPTPSPALSPRRPSRLVAQGGRDEPDTGEVPKRARRASEPPVKGTSYFLQIVLCFGSCPLVLGDSIDTCDNIDSVHLSLVHR